VYDPTQNIKGGMGCQGKNKGSLKAPLPGPDWRGLACPSGLSVILSEVEPEISQEAAGLGLCAE